MRQDINGALLCHSGKVQTTAHYQYDGWRNKKTKFECTDKDRGE